MKPAITDGAPPGAATERAPPEATDLTQMRAALALGRRGLGSTWPNPSVGCVLVREGRVVGRGVTQPGGRPHAEVVALLAAGEAARGATAYVTLEPCSHHGRTPPCADALIAAGVARLRAAGVDVVEGVLAGEAAYDLAGFLTRVRLGRPMVTLKLATTLDGRIATAAGESQWITGAESRRSAHGLRGTHDAVLAGIGTVLADDPALTCRIAGYRQTPVVRIVLDTRLRLPVESQLVRTAREAPVWVVHHPQASPARQEALERDGVRLFAFDPNDVEAAFQVLGAAGLTRVLVEGGAGVAASLLRAGVVDRLAWFHAPGVLGGNAMAGVAALGVGALKDMARFRRVRSQGVGVDVLTAFERVDR